MLIVADDDNSSILNGEGGGIGEGEGVMRGRPSEGKKERCRERRGAQ